MKLTVWQNACRCLVAFGMIALSLAPASAQEAQTGGAAVAAEQSAEKSAEAFAPVVMELFTSLICTNCPKADDLARELHEREDVLVLSYHVDYLNMGPMKDPLSHRAWTARQRWYRDLHQSAYVYTPQVVINGQHDVVGSDREAVLARLAAARHAHPEVRFSVAEGGHLLVRVDGAQVAGRALELLDLHFHKLSRARLSKRGSQLIERMYAHSVTHAERRALAGASATLQLSWLPDDFRAQGRAVLVQDRDSGAILGAYWGYRP